MVIAAAGQKVGREQREDSNEMGMHTKLELRISKGKYVAKKTEMYRKISKYYYEDAQQIRKTCNKLEKKNHE